MATFIIGSLIVLACVAYIWQTQPGEEIYDEYVVDVVLRQYFDRREFSIVSSWDNYEDKNLVFASVFMQRSPANLYEKAVEGKTQLLRGAHVACKPGTKDIAEIWVPKKSGKDDDTQARPTQF